MGFNLDYYLDKIKTERYARAMRENIVEAISLASKMGGSGGGSGGSGTITTDAVNIGTEAKYIPYIYANMYDGVLYELNDFEKYEFSSYRKSDVLACYIPQYEKFKVTVEVDPNSPELSVSDGIVKLGIICYSSLENQAYEYTLVFNNITRNNLSYTLNNLAGNRQYDSIQIVEKANMGRVHSNSHYGYIVKIELMDPGKFNSKVRYLLQEFIFNQSVTEPDDATPGRTDLTSYFNPRYIFINGYKFSYSITVTASGYTPTGIEIAKLYLYKEGTESYQTITITDSASEQTGDITVTADYDKIRLEYPTGLDGGAIMPYGPTIAMQIYPYSSGGAPLVQEYDITQHESEISGMGFRKVVFMVNDTALTDDFRDIELENLYYCSYSGSSQTVIDVYGEAQSETVSAMIYSTPGPIVSGITGIHHFINNKTNDHFIKIFTTATTSSSWTMVAPSIGNIDGSKIIDDTLDGSKIINNSIGRAKLENNIIGDFLADSTISLSKLEPDILTKNGEQGMAWALADNQHLPTTLTTKLWILYNNINKVVCPKESYAYNSDGAIIDISSSTAFSAGGAFTGKNPHYVYVSSTVDSIDAGWFTTLAPSGSSRNLDSLYIDNYSFNIILPSNISDYVNNIYFKGEFSYLDLSSKAASSVYDCKRSIAFGSDGSVISTNTNGTSQQIVSFNTNGIDVYSAFIDSEITVINSSFYTTHSTINKLYINQYKGTANIALNLPAESNIQVYYKGEFDLIGLLASSQAALNTRVVALENA